MKSKTIFTATAPDGTVFKRTSTSGAKYTFAVIGFNKSANTYFVQCWNSRRDLAERERSRMSSSASVVPVTAEVREVKERPDAEWPSAVRFTAAGIEFVRTNNGFEGRYKGLTIELFTTGRQFKALAYAPDDQWKSRVYSDGGSPKIESVIEKIIAKIEANGETPGSYVVVEAPGTDEQRIVRRFGKNLAPAAAWANRRHPAYKKGLDVMRVAADGSLTTEY